MRAQNHAWRQTVNRNPSEDSENHSTACNDNPCLHLDEIGIKGKWKTASERKRMGEKDV